MAANSLDAMQKQISLLLTSVNTNTKLIQKFSIRLNKLETKYEELEQSLVASVTSIAASVTGQPLHESTSMSQAANSMSRMGILERKLADMEQSQVEMEKLVAKKVDSRAEHILHDFHQLELRISSAVEDLHGRLHECGATTRESQKQGGASASMGTVLAPKDMPKTTGSEEIVPNSASMTVTGEDLNHNGIPDFLENMEKQDVKEGAEGLESGYEYETLENSIWDTILFIGLPQVGILGSVYVAFLVALNCFSQLALCCIINDVFTTAEIDADHISAMRKWRVSFGHSTDLMNKFTYQSFTSKVCNSPLAVQMNTAAAALMDVIGEYMPLQTDYDERRPVVGPIMPHSQGIGMYMSALATLLWAMQISINIQKISHKRWAFKTIPVAERTVLVHDGEKGTMVCVSFRRKVFCMAILFFELIVVVMLCFAGVFYIIRTLSMRDLLLNCSALSIVLQIDELFFTAMVPHMSRFLLTSLRPLPRPRSHNFKGMSWSSVFSLVLIGVIETLAILELQSQAQILEKTRDEICGGNQDFVARQDDAGVLTATQVDMSGDMGDTYYYHAMRNLITDKQAVHKYFTQSGSASCSSIEGGPWSLYTWTSMGLDKTVAFWNAACLDKLPVSDANPGSQYFLHMLQDLAKNYSIKDCTDLLRYCNEDTLAGVRTRAACPVSCGCDEPGAKMVLGGSHGCPTTCYESEKYNTSMWSRSCTDYQLDSPYWSQYGKGLNEYLNGYPLWSNAGGLSAELLSADGCDLVSMPSSIFGIPWIDLCEIMDADLKPLTYACPASCHCKARSRSMCPNQCGGPPV